MTQPVRKHYVEFYSPGTFIAESSTKPIAEWDVAEACRMAADITERHGARPYGFRFLTRLVAGPVPDGEGGLMNVEPKEVARSGMHYINGRLFTLDDIPDDAEHSILRGNMKSNGFERVVETRNGYRWTQPFESGDKIVRDGKVVEV